MKKKNGVISTILLGALVLNVNGVVSAAEPDGNGASTNASVKFEENNTPTDPIIENPGTPTDPEDPITTPDDPTGNTEALRIDLAPNFFFGKWKVGTGIQTAKNSRENSTLQVTDGRGTLTGWEVSVARTEFENAGDNLATTFTLKPGTVKNSLKEDVTLVGNVTADVVVDSTAKPIFSAGANEGGGTYAQTFAADDATLNFNTDNVKVGTYTSTLTWTLTSPVAEGAL